MKMIIETPNIKARKSLLDFVHEKVGKLEHLSDRIIEARVYLKVDKSDVTKNKVCEVKIVIPGDDLFASTQSNSFEDAVQQTVAALKHRIERWKNSNNKKLHETITPPQL
ncbi:Ribosome hibernation protein YhbH [Fulvivirga imtechensis AK7]|uniref:Ribosome hibernation protein YhbH n=1 Tax=Fulvivirga imtechensis AK7 TaxID=1237149 RepID=L8JWC0_9BACT|nr:HPF/RaiA family ribosome-associated protein [Fulvivirga imtechensis]ELR71914.1 Ribosome hibernation protein YhbH [Fulvivirga imtechensis AK7]